MEASFFNESLTVLFETFFADLITAFFGFVILAEEDVDEEPGPAEGDVGCVGAADCVGVVGCVDVVGCDGLSDGW